MTTFNDNLAHCIGQVEGIFEDVTRDFKPFKKYLVDLSGEFSEKWTYYCYHHSIMERVRIGDWIRFAWYQSGDFKVIDHLDIVREDGSTIWSFLADRKGKGMLNGYSYGKGKNGR